MNSSAYKRRKRLYDSFLDLYFQKFLSKKQHHSGQCKRLYIMKIYIFIFPVLLSLLTSCSYKYRYIYNTYVESTNIKNEHTYLDQNSKDSTASNPLSYQDSLFKFIFYPQPNGVYFEIQNLSDYNIYLLWDESYFIDPSNNSSKALNTDILNTQLKILDKQNNESIIPKRGTIRRFTTSSKNIVSVEKIDFSTYYLSPNLTLQNNYYNKIYLHNPYWVTASKITYSDKDDAKLQHDLEMDRIKHLVQSNNNLGIGFTFRVGEKKVDYDFKIRINKIFVYRYNEEFGNYMYADSLDILH